MTVLPPLTVRLLGPLRVTRRDGSQVDPTAWRTAKTRHLLRLLALQSGEPVRSELLVELLWPTVPPDRGRASLRTAASQLRRVLGEDCLARVGGSLVLRDAWVDVPEFERVAADARTAFAVGDAPAGLALADEALRLYRGDLAEDEPYLDPLLATRQRLQLVHRELVLEAADAALRLGRRRRAAELAELVARSEPSCERACRLLMQAATALSERAMGLRAYERCRLALAEELGADPAPPTHGLFLRLLGVASGHDTAPSNAVA